MDGNVTLNWAPGFNDGLVLGPFPIEKDWSINMKVGYHCATGGPTNLDTFKWGSYDEYKNEVGFSSANIKKATGKWGGLQYSSMECTEWCQRYEDCAACIKDEQCQFSGEHGGCIAADAYVYDFYCPRPAFAPITKVMYRESLIAYERESAFDGFDSSTVLRYSLDSRIDMSCPCNSRYRFEATFYEMPGMIPVYDIPSTPVRLNADHTFVDVPEYAEGKTYHVYSYLCVAQGTLDRDDCSPVKVDVIICDVERPGRPYGCRETGESHGVVEGMFEVS
jgi:hypothetical protein